MSDLPEEPLRILVIDGNPMGRSTISGLLKERYSDCDVQSVPSIGEAVEAILAYPFHCLVSHAMNSVPAEELVRVLRRIHPLIPIVSTADVEMRGATIDAGATRFVRYGAWHSLASTVWELIVNSRCRYSDRDGRSRPESRMLIAHGCERTRESIRTRIEDSDPSVAIEEAGSEMDALQVLRGCAPDLAFVDAAMAACIADAQRNGVINRATSVVYLLSA